MIYGVLSELSEILKFGFRVFLDLGETNII